MPDNNPELNHPAKRLLGLTLEGGWKVVAQRELRENDTGGCFSTGYIVESPDGKQAFLKAMDYSEAFYVSPPDIASRLEQLTNSIKFEREIVKRCSEKRLDRVVKALAGGTLRLPGGGRTDVVEYLVFELAKCDVRRQMDSLRRLDFAWRLRALHHIATGLDQLHRNGIAHQDLKPSNVLVFESEISKIGDLGRAACKGFAPPHYNLHVPGDLTYAPPELLYGHIPTDWNARRFGCDAYHLGSMVVYFLTGVCMTELLRSKLPENMHYKRWGGSYQQVLPYLESALSRAVQEVAATVDQQFRDELAQIVLELCSPQLEYRGHPRNRIGHANPYALERYVSRFDLLARKALIRGL